MEQGQLSPRFALQVVADMVARRERLLRDGSTDPDLGGAERIATKARAWEARLCGKILEAVAWELPDADGDVGLEGTGVNNDDDELELRIRVGNAVGTMWLSEAMWRALGVKEA